MHVQNTQLRIHEQVPRRILSSSALLFTTDVSGLPIGGIFMGHAV